MADLFDLPTGEALKDDGKTVAEANNALSPVARAAAFQLAATHPQRECCIDDVYAELQRQGVDTGELYKAAGSVFRGARWEQVSWRKSTRASNHARNVMVWRLK